MRESARPSRRKAPCDSVNASRSTTDVQPRTRVPSAARSASDERGSLRSRRTARGLDREDGRRQESQEALRVVHTAYSLAAELGRTTRLLGQRGCCQDG
eukprot:1064416-Pleurochrysis_carterae.AAC.1